MAQAIDKKITGYRVKTEDQNAGAQTGGAQTVPLATQAVPLEREDVLTGVTIKFKPFDDAYYITINFQNDRPYEVLINTKDVTQAHNLFTVALMLSAIFRAGGEYQFILDEMKTIHDPKGGGYIKGYGFQPSLIAAVATVIDAKIRERLCPSVP